ncbi:helix-turn-helix domain-containing protein [Erythrobacteraceae bacterium CFH 75059]|uniref:helix-turn-helix domain-containing protein n=1 Tax=Qipengyuania thermophila TaxID=2509361 RepID=UPI001021C638|nr:helix-turn-helix domain-containing protein [Qipengyuania thermophila]TCD04114.1 helix-turn-helix domain-containing protein [Erythrobacteraceae bacterium CFH 75059]
MTDDDGIEAPPVQHEGAGQRLRQAREKAGYDLKDVAGATRIPERHLLAIENGEFDRLPAPAYAVGFSRSYARMVGADEQSIVEQVRAEVGAVRAARPERAEKFEPGDPARVPSRRLAWFGALAIVLLIIGMFTFYRTYLAPGMGPPPLTADDANAVAAAPAGAAPTGAGAPGAAVPAPAAGGQVVFTALEPQVWARFYDRAGNRLIEKQFAQGEQFAVPRDADGVQIWTGRPDALAITIDGRPVPKLADRQQIMRDVPVSAEALLARPAGGAAPAASPPPVPVGAAPARP